MRERVSNQFDLNLRTHQFRIITANGWTSEEAQVPRSHLCRWVQGANRPNAVYLRRQ
ncbi:hypothetical protein Mapa_007705 [Marchantia paleacea]|nr:hypothetical protein Mapa_007705 [Marchantia paleacea]